MTPNVIGADVLDRLTVVLVEPRNPLNIGGALRAVRNMGIRDLRLVAPADDDPAKIAVTAPGLEREAGALPRFERLAEAIADGVLVLGFTARARRVARETWSLEELPARLVERCPDGQGRVHLLFGREDFGLSNASLDCCNAIVAIETDAENPSLNLAQAVLLACYRLRRATGVAAGSAPHRPRQLANAESVSGLMSQIESALELIEFFKFPGARTTVLRTLAGLFGRAQLDDREARTLRAIFGEVIAVCQRQGASRA